jgi:UDP-glucose 4-epimerase
LLLQTAAAERPFFEIYGDDYPTPDGTCLRDFVHVLDIAEAHLLALRVPEKPAFSVYNIGTGTSYSVRQICEVVEQELCTSIARRNGPRRPGDPAVLCANPQRLMQDLAWRPLSSDLRTIVRTAWDWKQKNPGGYGGRHEAQPVLTSKR